MKGATYSCHRPRLFLPAADAFPFACEDGVGDRREIHVGNSPKIKVSRFFQHFVYKILWAFSQTASQIVFGL